MPKSNIYLSRKNIITGTLIVGAGAAVAYGGYRYIRPDKWFWKADDFVKEGDDLYQSGHYRKSLESFTKAISLDKTCAKGYEGKGKATRMLGNVKEAIKYFKQAVELDDDLLSAKFWMVIAFSQADKKEQAAKLFSEIEDKQPKDFYTYRIKGIALQALSRFDEAIASYTEAIKLKPDHHAAYNNKGNALQALRRFDEAIASYEEAIKLKPDDHSAYNNKGNALQDLGRFDEAIASYEEAIKLKPDDALIYCNKGVSLSKLGRDKEALECFNKASQLVEEGKAKAGINNFSERHVNYIDKVLSQDKQQLIEKLAQTQEKVVSAKEALVLYRSRPVDPKELESLRKKLDKKKVEVDTIRAELQEEFCKEKAKIKQQFDEQRREMIKMFMEYSTTQADNCKKLSRELEAAKQNIIEELGGRIDLVESDLSDLRADTKKMIDDLKIVGIEADADLQNQVNKLEDCAPEMHRYFKVLFIELSSYLESYKFLGSGLVEGKSLCDLQKSSKFSNIKGAFSSLMQSGFDTAVIFEEVTKFVDKFARHYAVYAAVRELAVGVLDKREENLVQNQIEKMHKVLDKKFFDIKGLNINEIVKIALKLTHIRQEKINSSFNPDEEKKLTLIEQKAAFVDSKLEELGATLFGKVIERYEQNHEKLAAHDALMILGYMCNDYLYIINTEIQLSELFDEWKVKELEISKQLANVLDKVNYRAENGHWNKYRGNDLKNPNELVREHKGLKDMLEDNYIKDQLGKMWTLDNIEMTKMIFFSIISAVARNSDKAFECVSLFKNKYPALFNKIAKEHPEYFVGNKKAIDLIDNQNLASKIEVYAMYYVHYENKLLHPDLLGQLQNFYSIDELVHLGNKVSDDLIDHAHQSGDCSQLLLGLQVVSMPEYDHLG